MTGPIRTCVVCRLKAAQGDFVRVAWDDGRQELVIGGNVGGRSVYACNSDACRKGLCEKGRVERALKRSVPGSAMAALRESLSGGS